MKGVVLYISIGFVVLLSGCATDSNYDDIDREISKISTDITLSDFRWLLVLPRQGCTGCINSVRKQLFQNINHFKDVLVLINRVQDKKILKAELSANSLLRPNVVVDWNDDMRKLSLAHSDYPLLILIDGPKIVKQATLNNPRDSTWVNLLK